MLEFNNIKEMKKYYNEETDAYEFIDENGVKQDITINFDLSVAANIIAGNIKACNIDVFDIRAYDINARNIVALNIYTYDINYYSYCIAYESLKCKSIESRRGNGIHKCLDNEIEYIKEEKLTEEEVIEQLEELLKKEDRQALKRAVELLKQSNKVKLELKSFKDDIVEKQEKNKEHRLLISLKRLQPKIENIIEIFDN